MSFVIAFITTFWFAAQNLSYAVIKMRSLMNTNLRMALAKHYVVTDFLCWLLIHTEINHALNIDITKGDSAVRNPFLSTFGFLHSD
jgi:hypothetical protein